MTARTAVSLVVSLASIAGAAMATARAAEAQALPAPEGRAVSSRNYQEIYERYLQSARSLPPAPGVWMADLMTDRVARRVNDLVTVRVVENLVASGSADSKVGKSSEASVEIPMPRVAQELGRVVPSSTDIRFNGAGGTTRTTQLSATITARVVEVLPNGDLVVEGVREVDINGDRSLVILTGVVRPTDVMPGNIVASTRVGQLQIRSLSQGLIKDSLSPGWLVRVINRIF